MVAAAAAPRFTVGTRVGAQRWPLCGAHPDAWEPPHVGTLLALDDPDAWPGLAPWATPADLPAHVARLQAEGLLTMHVPVRWDFGQVHWERWDQLTTPERDRHNWGVARDLRYQDIARPYPGRRRG